MKISIIGAGNVGSTIALLTTCFDLADVVMLDIAEDLAKAKALDISHALSALNCDKGIKAASDYKEISNSDIVVITAGLPRKPGMSREQLVQSNSEIVKKVISNIKQFSPNAIILVVTNPLDTMTYLAYKLSGFNSKKVLGMAGVLDASRFKELISRATSTKRSKIATNVLGTHGDTMVPLLSQTEVEGKPICDLLENSQIDEILTQTKQAGGEIVSLLKTGSAYYGPAASCFKMCKAIVHDKKEVLPASVYLEGEYGLKDVCVGVPVCLGKEGIEEIIVLKLTKGELDALHKSAESVKETVKCMKLTE